MWRDKLSEEPDQALGQMQFAAPSSLPPLPAPAVRGVPCGFLAGPSTLALKKPGRPPSTLAATHRRVPLCCSRMLTLMTVHAVAPDRCSRSRRRRRALLQLTQLRRRRR
jgi:hypothetical protein